MDKTLNDRLDRDFRQALARAIEDTPLTGEMPWLALPGAKGGFWVGLGLSQWDTLPAHTWETFVFVQYRSEDPQDPHADACPLDLRLKGTGARDAELLAGLVLAAVLRELAPDLADQEVRG